MYAIRSYYACLTTYVMDVNNTLGDETVTLLPNVKNTYLNSTFNDYATTLSSITSSWTVGTRRNNFV